MEAILNPSYFDAEGARNEFPFTLNLYQQELQISYGISSVVAVGALGTYRENRYCCSGSIALTDSGISGLGVFLDLAPRWPSRDLLVARIGYEPQRSPRDITLPVSDGQDRIFLRSDWKLFGTTGVLEGIRLRVDADYGRPNEIQPAYVRGSVELASQLRVVRAARFDLDVAAEVGYIEASDARENGTIFHNRTARQERSGLELKSALGRLRRTELSVEARHDFGSHNALGGWRVALNYRTLLKIAR
jgi:hypothetical protein